MADPRFYEPAGPFTLGEIAAAIQAPLPPDADPSRLIHDVGGLAEATPDSIAYFEDRRYIAAFRTCRAGVCLIAPADQALVDCPAGMLLLTVPVPQRAFIILGKLFYPDIDDQPGRRGGEAIDPTAEIAENASIAPGAIIGRQARIGARSRIEPGAVIGRGVVIGTDCVIGANSTISHALIGSKVVIKPGARIGQAGFGFIPTPEGVLRVSQLGRVVIDDAVEIGSNTTVDRGTAGDTMIGSGTMVDNMVHIGHNVRIGRGCILVSLVGVSGSTWLEDYVVIGGQSGLSGHLRIGKAARIAARTGVFRDLEAGAEVAGYPAVPVRQWHRQSAILSRLAKRKDK